VLTTCLSDAEATEACPDSGIESLLVEVRACSGMNIRVRQQHTAGGRWWWRWQRTTYSLYVHVGGMLPWQYVMCGSGARETTLAYLYGYLQGMDDAGAARRKRGGNDD